MTAANFARILVVARKELTDTFRDRRTIMVTLLSAAAAGPVFLILIFNLIASQAERVRELKLPTRGIEQAGALRAFLERQQVSLTPAPADYEARVRSGDLDVVLIVDDKFTVDVQAGRQGTVRLIFDRSRDRARASIDQVQALLRAYNRQWGTQRMLLRGVSPTVGNPLNIENFDVATPQQSGAIILFLVAYYGLFAAVMGGMAVALDSTAGERERQSLEPLLTTPARPFELVAGKWLAVSTLNGTVVSLTLAGFYLTLSYAPLPAVGVPFLFGAREFGRFIVILLPLILLMPAILLFVGSRGRTFKEAQTNVSVLLFVVSLIPVVQMFLQRKEPDWIALVPISGQYALLNQALRGEVVSIAQWATSCLVPALLIVLFLGMVARLFARESVLIGKS